MKIVSLIKRNFLGFVVGIVLATGVTTVALTMASKDVSYDNTNSGSEKTTVQGAIDDLYELVNATGIDLLWENPDPTAAFSAQTINLDLSKYSFIILAQTSDLTSEFAGSIMGVGYQHNHAMGWSGGGPIVWSRGVTITESSIVFDNCLERKSTGNTTNNKYGIPKYIYGVKTSLPGI